MATPGSPATSHRISPPLKTAPCTCARPIAAAPGFTAKMPLPCAKAWCKSRWCRPMAMALSASHRRRPPPPKPDFSRKTTGTAFTTTAIARAAPPNSTCSGAKTARSVAWTSPPRRPLPVRFFCAFAPRVRASFSNTLSTAAPGAWPTAKSSPCPATPRTMPTSSNWPRTIRHIMANGWWTILFWRQSLPGRTPRHRQSATSRSPASPAAAPPSPGRPMNRPMRVSLLAPPALMATPRRSTRPWSPATASPSPA